MDNRGSLAQAQVLEQKGLLGEAELAYRRLLDEQSDSVVGWFRLGIVCLRQRKSAEAVAALKRATRLQPDFAEAWNTLGIAHATMSDAQHAVEAFCRAVELRGDRADFHRNLGSALSELNSYEAAERSLRTSNELEADNVGTLFNLAQVLRRLGRPRDAISCLRDVVRLQSFHVDAICSLSEVSAELEDLESALQGFRRAIELSPELVKAQVGLGVVLARMGQPRDAIAYFRRALQLEPDSAETLANLGMALTACGQDAEALDYLLKSLHLFHGNPKTHLVLGNVHLRLGDLPSAVASYETAIAQQPDSVEAHHCLGVAFDRMGRAAQAEACLRQALQLDPEFAQAHRYLAVIRLRQGDWEQGWTGYAWRLRCPGVSFRHATVPLWDGRPIDGQTILLQSEQGLGDTIQFVRYARLVKERAGKVVLACPPGMVPLLSSCRGIDEFLGIDDEPPSVDWRAPLMSLPGIFRTTLDTVPCEIPYLCAADERVSSWSERLYSDGKLKVGIAWRGNPGYIFDAFRSVALAALAPLFDVAAVQLYSLQKETSELELNSLWNRFRIVDLSRQLDQQGGAFMDTAAVMKSLDVVVTVDSALAHLAGALGVPVLLALSYVADWRWLDDRNDTPWYPTVKIFRQKQLDVWADVFARIAEELNLMVAGRWKQREQTNPSDSSTRATDIGDLIR